MRTFRIIEKLNGRKAVAEIVTRELRPITMDTVRMWCQRGRIPGDAVRVLIAAVEARGGAVEAADLMVFEKGEAA